MNPLERKKGFFSELVEDFRFPPSKTSIKIVLIGDGATGKTSYFNRLIGSDNPDYKFNKVYDATRGCNICQIEYKIGKYPITIHLFDTAGQEKFGLLRDSYMSGADAIILMYDLSEPITKQNVLTKWIPEVKRLLTASRCTQYIPIAVIGNKNDKLINRNPISKDQIGGKTFRSHDSDDIYSIPGIRKSTLLGAYESKFGHIEHFYISVKADENLIKPINWLLRNVLSYYMPVEVVKTSKQSAVFLCNK
jgi:small GTP-binding protein